MALARREFQVTDQAGNIVTDAQVEVRLDVPGQPLASIFEDRDGTIPRDNPFTVDSNGVAAFHAAGGAYRVRAFSGAFERIERYVAIGTAAETDAGALPVSGPPGWVFDSATADTDPGDGEFRLNNASPGSATAAYIDNLAQGGIDLSAWLQAIDDGGDATSRGLLTIFDPNTPNTVFRIYSVSGAVVDGTGYRKLTIAHVTGAGSFPAGTRYQFTFSRTGPIGPQGPEGPEGPEGPQGPQGPPGSGGGSSVDRQVFNSSGTWTKPGSGTIARIECWGGGGSGGRGGAGDAGGGGGGGSYVERWMPLSAL